MAKHQCLSCGERFEGPEFFSYLLKLRSKTVLCLRCQTDNYIVPQRNVAYFIFLLISILTGLIIFAIPNLGFAAATYSPSTETYRVSFLALIGGAALGLAAARLVMNVFNWMFGKVSQDRKYKSASDYEG